jgi:hypothetical protein
MLSFEPKYFVFNELDMLAVQLSLSINVIVKQTGVANETAFA